MHPPTATQPQTRPHSHAPTHTHTHIHTHTQVLMLREQAAISCNTGYQLSGSEDRKRTPKCLANGSFEAGEVCQPRYCGVYSAPADGSVWPRRGVSFMEQQVNISCNAGFKHAGAGTEAPRCLADGSFE